VREVPDYEERRVKADGLFYSEMLERACNVEDGSSRVGVGEELCYFFPFDVEASPEEFYPEADNSRVSTVAFSAFWVGFAHVIIQCCFKNGSAAR